MVSVVGKLSMKKERKDQSILFRWRDYKTKGGNPENMSWVRVFAKTVSVAQKLSTIKRQRQEQSLCFVMGITRTKARTLKNCPAFESQREWFSVSSCCYCLWGPNTHLIIFYSKILFVVIFPSIDRLSLILIQTKTKCKIVNVYQGFRQGTVWQKTLIWKAANFLEFNWILIFLSLNLFCLIS
jgi:hypothetical protein